MEAKLTLGDAEQLEHASIKITVDTYGHPRQGNSIALADRLDSPGTHALRYAPARNWRD